jgi:hypothetical protein
MSLIGYNIIAQGGYLQRQYRFLLSRVYKIFTDWLIQLARDFS